MTAAAPLPALDRRARLEGVIGALGGTADALVVTKGVNVRWLCGFTGSNATLLLAADRRLLVTDGRYAEQAAAELAAADVEVELAVTSPTGPTIRGAADGLTTVALEAAAVTWDEQRRIAADWLPDAVLVPTVDLVERCRERKEPGEIARIEAAAAIADAALAEVAPSLLDGPTEAEVASALDVAMRRRGAEGPAFDTIVASGPDSARPHHRPGARRIAPGDLVVIDMGACVDGYRSDMTRTFVVGDPTPAQQRMLDVVTAAQSAGVAAIAPGVACSAVDAAAREVIAAAGWADAFVHPTGHGLGLEIHEALRLSTTSAATLAAGHAVTVEPGVYLSGTGGVRVEDTVEVTADGARPLTRFPKAAAPA